MNPRASAALFNVISLVFLVLTILVIVWGALQFMRPPQTQREDVAVPTPQQLPTITPTFTPTNTQPPTWTPTPTNTETPTVTQTPTATLRATNTITPTPGVTDTPPSTDVPPPTETPAGSPTSPPSPFPFALRNNQVTFTSNFANTAGCDWQGIGGQVFDLNGQPFDGLQVHVFGDNIDDLYTLSGSNTLYGQGSGWEVPLGSVINNNLYFVELRSQEGTQISPPVQITFPGSCQGNLAIVNFEQTRPF